MTLKIWFVLFTDIKCYVPITHFVPQGLERIYASSLHLAFMSEHNVASGDLWHADKSKGSVHPNLFSHFICTIFCWRNCPPWTIIGALRWISIYSISKSSLFWTTQSSIYLYCTGVFLILKFQIKVKPAVGLYWTVVVVFLLYFGELTFYVNLSMTLSWIKESKCSNNILYLLIVPRLSVAKTYLDHSFSGRSVKIFRIKESWLLFESFFSVWLRVVPDV